MKIFVVSFVLAVAVSGQPKFEVASVKRAEQCGGGGSIDPGVVALRGVPLKAVLMEAFQVKMEQIEGPSWLETDCFEISAKIPEGVTKDQLPQMLQALLTERFKLAARKEVRSRSGYALVVDKGGPKFKEDDANASFMGRERGKMLFGSAASPYGVLKGVMTMASVARDLSTKGFGPVEDLTGLTGKYGIELRWTRNPDFETIQPGTAYPTPQGWPEADLFAALREQLGLKLERREVQVQYLVVDHIERALTEN